MLERAGVTQRHGRAADQPVCKSTGFTPPRSAGHGARRQHEDAAERRVVAEQLEDVDGTAGGSTEPQVLLHEPDGWAALLQGPPTVACRE